MGLTPVLKQSGESNRVGQISLCGDDMMRTLLYEASQVLLTRVTKWSWLKAWAMGVAKRRGLKKAIVALARRLAVIMHRMWIDGAEFRWTRENAPVTAGATHRNATSNKGYSSSANWRKDVPRGTMDEVSSPCPLCRSLRRDQDARQIVPPHPADPHAGRAMRLIPKRSEGPRVISKIADCHGLNALDSNRPNREGTAIPRKQRSSRSSLPH